MKQPNRIAALSGSAGAIVAVLLAILGAVDSTPKAIVVVAALLVIGLVVAVFLIGSQKWEELVFRRDNGTPDQTVQVTGENPAFRAALEAQGDTPHTKATTNALTTGPDLPEGEDPDPIDAAVDNSPGDDPLLLALLNPSNPQGKGYVYGTAETPPPDERDDNITAFIRADSPEAQDVDPIPKEG